MPEHWPTIRTKPGRRLTEGDRVGSLEVVAAPGHTPGHVAFLDTRDRALIGGDVFTTYGRTEVTNHFYWRFPFAAMATEDGAVDADSARKLRALEPSLLLVGHGAAVRQPVAAMDAALTRLWYLPTPSGSNRGEPAASGRKRPACAVRPSPR
jgi:glyoxylase-like metal-dependent hydrolase (beta-lactamase superfamily II)